MYKPYPVTSSVYSLLNFYILYDNFQVFFFLSLGEGGSCALRFATVPGLPSSLDLSYHGESL